MNPKVILRNRHIEIILGDVHHCVEWHLSEAVEGQLTGEVGSTFDTFLTDADVMEQLKHMVVDELNAIQTTFTFDVSDILSWETGS